MLQFEEYKVKLNNLKPEIEGLDKALGIEQAKREVEELEIKSSQPGFWDNPEESQKIVSRMVMARNLSLSCRASSSSHVTKSLQSAGIWVALIVQSKAGITVWAMLSRLARWQL